MCLVRPFAARQCARDEAFAEMLDLGVGGEETGSEFGHFIGSW
jgi:hypothetical protein